MVVVLKTLPTVEALTSMPPTSPCVDEGARGSGPMTRASSKRTTSSPIQLSPSQQSPDKKKEKKSDGGDRNRKKNGKNQ